MPTPSGRTFGTLSKTSTRRTDLVEAERGGQAADPGADHDDRASRRAIPSEDFVDVDAHRVAAALAGRHREEVVHPGEPIGEDVDSRMWVRK